MNIVFKHHKSWNGFFSNKNFNPIEELERIEKEIGNEYFPDGKNVLRFMRLDLSKAKYVVVGMEPYPSSFEKDGIIIPEATGRSFEVASLIGKTWCDKFKQSSLRNILKAIYYNETGKKEDLKTIRGKIADGSFVISNPADWFDKTEEQGVLWLNATFTVKPYEVDTHREHWERFMKEVVAYMCKQNPKIKWVLWGNQAKDRILPLVDSKNAICSVHPRLPKFVDENCFRYMGNVDWVC